jgi:hypothetical protein
MFVMGKDVPIITRGRAIQAGMKGAPLGVAIFNVFGGANIGATGYLSSMLGGGIGGYLVGKTFKTKWDAAVLAIPYNQAEVQKLGCTFLPAKRSISIK